jgi:hypothetical protein
MLKWQMTAIAVSGAVTVGAIFAAVIEQHAVTGNVGAKMNVGQTVTSTTPTTVPPVAVARPSMKATRPKGF